MTKQTFLMIAFFLARPYLLSLLNLITSSCEKIVDFIIKIPAINDYLEKVYDSGSTGCDNIPSDFLKNCPSQLTPLVEALFNNVISN